MAQNVVLDNKSLETIDFNSLPLQLSLQDYINLYLTQNGTIETKLFDEATGLKIFYQDTRAGGYGGSLGNDVNETNRFSKFTYVETIQKNFGYDSSKYEGLIEFPHYQISYPNWYYRGTQTASPFVTSSSTGITKIHCFNDPYFTGIYQTGSDSLFQVSNTGGWNPIACKSSGSDNTMPGRINNEQYAPYQLCMGLRIDPNKIIYTSWKNELIKLSGIANSLIDIIYPVGAVYISTASTSPQTLFGGSWESIGTGRCLMGADSSHAAGTTAEAGLPNISGNFPASLEGGGTFATSGAFALAGKGYFGGGVSGTDYDNYGLNFDASRCSAIYGKSSTVQPPAYYVYIWRRIG